MISPKSFIQTTGFKPKKLFGQNFLVHPEGATKLVRFSGITGGDHVLEIGPGLGALTQALLETGAFVTSVEKDDRLVEELLKNGPKSQNFRLIHQDALDFQFGSISPRGRKWKVVANLPYSVSTPLLEMLLTQIEYVESMALLMQEEVVHRICASPGGKDYGRLSIWLQMLCETEKGFRVPRGSFYPVPDVESRVVRLVPRSEPLVPQEDQDAFLKLVAKAFMHRRKTLRNSIHVDSSRRPETLTIQEFYTLLKSQSKPS